MNLKQSLLMALTALSLSLSATAQDFAFDEVTYTPAKTTFRLFAPRKAKAVLLRLYDDGSLTPSPRPQGLRMHRADGDLWQLEVRGDLKGKFYTFDVLGPARRGRSSTLLSRRAVRSYGEGPGVFAKAVGVNGQRGAVVDLRDTDPEGWADDVRPPLLSAADLVVYELHHRDFSIARNGLAATEPWAGGQQPCAHPGRFLALTEPWALDHLRKLGVNAVHLLPSFDFASIDEAAPDRPQYNWGYDPLNYNVPEGSYATDARRPEVRIREFKQMVQALHRAGIRVILDVVYNHTFDIAGSNFQKTYPDYFFRKTADGRYSDGSGCGNETASERPMMRRFMLESVRYWATEYHVDGFRFDLMGVHDLETMRQVEATLHALDPTLFVYGEGWSAGVCAYPQDSLALKAHMRQLPRVAAFGDELRDALRGPFDDDTKGAFLAGVGGSEESLKAGIAGMVAHPQVDYTQVNYSREPWAAEPTQMMAYVSCHDDMCLTDRLRASLPGIGDDELLRLDLLAQTAVLTSQGIPFLLSGEELLRDKKGVHNSYNAPDSVNRLDWSRLQCYPQVMAYYSGLIALRKAHPLFRLGTAERVRRCLSFLPVEPCLVGYVLDGEACGDSWRGAVVVLNANREARGVDIPEGTYTVVAREGRIDAEGLDTLQGPRVTVPAQSALILRRH